MDTSNRQVEESSERTVTVTSDRVAVIANLKRIGCEELMSEEWIDLINVALVHAKPHFKYLPFFLPVKQRKLKHFCFSMNYAGDGKEYEDSFWSEDDFIVKSDSPPDGTLAAVVESAKVVQICEVSSDKEDRCKSMKVLLNTHGVFILAHCRYPEPEKGRRFVSGTPTIYCVEVLPEISSLKPFITVYPQIGPDTLFAISAMVNDTYKKRSEDLRNLDCIGKRLRAICNNVNAGHGHYIQRWPWGVSDGSGKIVEQVGH